MVIVVIATICALAWICYRISSLLNIPIPTLVKLLGLDLPTPPRVSLHGISADTITLHWSLPEKAGSIAKHIIQINGINVGESEKRGETSVTVTGLNPDHRYNVRVIAANPQNFQAPGQLIRLRTRQKLQTPSDASGQSLKGESSDDSPSVHPILDVPTSAHHNRHNQQSHHNQHHRRTTKERRSLPALEHLRLKATSKNDQHSVESLTRDLDVVRNEIQDAETQLAHAEEEYKSTEAVLRIELDALKEKKNEEDLGRQRIRAETKSLEESRRVAEANKTRTEKALKVKEYEIKKMQDDIAKWEEEKMAALEKVEELLSAAQESQENAVTTEKELSNDIQETQKHISEMEDEIRSLMATLRTLENQKHQLKADEDEETQRLREEHEKERLWRHRRGILEMRYVTIYNAFQAAELDFIRSREALISSQSRRGSGSGGDSISKKPKQRRSRNRKGRPQIPSAPISSYPVLDSRFSDASTFKQTQYQQISPTFTNGMSSSPFFNFANGTVTSSTEIPEIDSTGPIMELNGAGPMSPTANALLPSNLFSLEDNSPSPPSTSPGTKGVSIRNPSLDISTFKSPTSPISSESVSTSPQNSFNHVPLFTTLSTNDEDTKCINNMPPIGSNRPLSTPNDPSRENTTSNINGGRRFVRLLSNSFNRQRGKTMPFDGPPIGSLRPLESQSFPKNDCIGLDPIGTRRRSGSYGSWTNGFDFLYGPSKGKTTLQRTNSHASRHSATFNQFNPSFDPIDPDKLFDPPISPRPSSIASFDNPLPAPSLDASAAFGWPTHDSLENSNGIGLLGHNHWADFRTGRISRSRPVSRPISPITNNSTTSLSLLPSQQLGGPCVNYFSSTLVSNVSGHPTTPRLNPTAPTFQSKHLASRSEEVDEHTIDNMSIRTDISAPSTMGTSGTSLETLPTKESILSRFSISRKGSTSKFNIGWKKSKRDESEDEGTEVQTATTSASSARHLWSSWKKDKDREEGDDYEVDRPEKLTLATTPLAKESSPWMKNSQSGFFGTIGRKKGGGSSEQGDIEEKIKEKDKDKLEKEAEGEKKGLSIFKRKPISEKEKEDAPLVIIEEI